MYRKMRKIPGNYRHGDLANALLEDAMTLIETRSADELSLRELAERAGVSPRAPYAHFPAKRDLLRGLARRGFAELTERSRAAGTDLYALGEVYIRFATSHPHLFRLMFGGNDLPADCEEPGASFLHLVHAIRINDPALGEPDAYRAALALWAFVHGLADLRIERLVPEDVWDANELRALSAALVRALGKEKPF
jgi:AcrR family transcriptional regulator